MVHLALLPDNPLEELWSIIMPLSNVMTRASFSHTFTVVSRNDHSRPHPSAIGFEALLLTVQRTKTPLYGIISSCPTFGYLLFVLELL